MMPLQLDTSLPVQINTKPRPLTCYTDLISAWILTFQQERRLLAKQIRRSSLTH